MFPFIVGAAFGFGWTPCIGPILGSILTIAALEENIGKSILLQGWRSSDEDAFENSLIWSEYEAFPDGTLSYEILRAPSRLGVAVPLTSHGANVYHTEDYIGDLTELPGDFCYTVVALENNSTGGLNGSSSNQVCLTEDPLLWIPTAFTPNNDDIGDGCKHNNCIIHLSNCIIQHPN